MLKHGKGWLIEHLSKNEVHSITIFIDVTEIWVLLVKTLSPTDAFVHCAYFGCYRHFFLNCDMWSVHENILELRLKLGKIYKIFKEICS